MSLTSEQRRHYRALAHHLKPIIIVGDKGVSERLLQETERALEDHELIKAKLSSNDREQRAAMIEELVSASKAELVQVIGKVAILVRKAQKPNPKLSNLLRSQTPS